jgi:competence protein ComEC
MAGGLSSLPYHAVYFSNPYLKYWLVYAYLLLGTAYLIKTGSRRRYAVAAILAAGTLAVTLWVGAARYTAGRLDITVLDVGQGESVALSSGGVFALIDCGSANSWYSAGNIAADTLQSRGCGRLDYLLLTHYDSDHVSGVTELLSRMQVTTLLAPDVEDDSGQRETVLQAAERRGTEVRLLTEAETLPMGDAVLTVYPPLGDSGDNERGLSCLVTAGDYDLLVTGDMSSATESLLLERYDLPDIEALVVGHHGSKNSTSQALLSALTPETAIISVGSNRYGHPTNQTLRRLLAAGAEIYRTDLQGSIHISVN